MSRWPASKARIAYRALLGIGWAPARQSGSHIQLKHPDFSHEFTWAFHDNEELGPRMLARIAKRTGLKPQDI
jgi:predicted RNA binding protein YcfA (HicA-like mRNA interferase family)